MNTSSNPPTDRHQVTILSGCPSAPCNPRISRQDQTGLPKRIVQWSRYKTAVKSISNVPGLLHTSSENLGPPYVVPVLVFGSALPPKEGLLSRSADSSDSPSVRPPRRATTGRRAHRRGRRHPGQLGLHGGTEAREASAFGTSNGDIAWMCFRFRSVLRDIERGQINLKTSKDIARKEPV